MANEPMDPETRAKLKALKKRRGLGRSLADILGDNEPSEVLGTTLFADTSGGETSNDDSSTANDNTDKSKDNIDDMCSKLAARITEELNNETINLGQAEEYGEGTSGKSTRVKSLTFLPFFERVTCDEIKTLDNWETLVINKDIPAIAMGLDLKGVLHVVFWKWGSEGQYGASGTFPYSEFYLCRTNKVYSIGAKILDWEREYGYTSTSKGTPPGDRVERKKLSDERKRLIDEASQFGVNTRSRKKK